MVGKVLPFGRREYVYTRWVRIHSSQSALLLPSLYVQVRNAQWRIQLRIRSTAFVIDPIPDSEWNRRRRQHILGWEFGRQRWAHPTTKTGL